jgi:HEAT repeat protein
MAALASLVNKAQPGSSEHSESARYLADSGDQQWFPILREVAIENAENSIYPDYAATLGREKMLPTLISLLDGSNRQFAPVSAAGAMGFTGSRAAVPILIELLKNPDPEIAERARYGLRQLTHRAVSLDNTDNPQSSYLQWSHWWALEGHSAPIYKANDCGEITQLQ